MRHGDTQLAIPYISFTGTRASIESINSPVVGMTAVATDNPTAPHGVYNGSIWVWKNDGVVLIMETGVTFPPVPLTSEEGDDWIYST